MLALNVILTFFTISFSCERSVKLWQGVRKHWYELFLGTFAKLREATFRFVVYIRLSGRPSAHMEQLCSHWTDFLKILHLIALPKYVEKIKVSLKSNKNSGCFTWRLMYIYDRFVYRWMLLRMRNVSDKFVEIMKQNLCSVIFFFFRKSCLFLDNVEKWCRAEQTTWKYRVIEKDGRDLKPL
jgi:hypothetical protein